MKKILLLVILLQFSFGFAQTQFSREAIEKFQNELNAEYADSKTSPLLPEDLKEFKSLDYYPANEKFYVVAQFVRTPNEQPFEMKTSTDRKPVYVKPSIDYKGKFRKGHVRMPVSTKKNAIKSQNRSRYYYQTRGKYRRKKN